MLNKDMDDHELTIDEAIAKAVDNFNAARFGDAEGLCNAILAAMPDNIDAVNMLGVIAQKVNRHDMAVKRFLTAIEIDDKRGMLHFNLAISLYQIGQQNSAVESLKTAMEIEPNNRQFKNFFKEIKQNPTPTQSTKTADNGAEQILQSAIAAHTSGDLDAAIKFYNMVLAIDKKNTSALCNMAVALQQQKKLDKAVATYKKALAIKPDLVEAHSNLGNALVELGRVEEGAVSYKQAISINPAFASAHNNLGKVRLDQNRLNDAVLCYQKAIELKPTMAEAHCNLGTVYNKQGVFDSAVSSFKKAISIKPDYPEAYSGLGDVLQEQGKYEQAVASYNKALDFKPDYTSAHSNMIFCIDMFSDIATDLFQTERERFNRLHAEPLRKFWPTFNNSVDSNKVLRIGYVNADFKHHSASHIFGPVLLNHDRDKFAIYCYAGNSVEDDMTEQYKKIATNWVSTVNMDDATLAAQIHRDKIDVLVDTAGHTKGNRLMVFARKPAPIQITAWGYPHGTAMAAMDYLFADPIFIPADERHKYREQIIDLSCVIHLNPYTDYPDVTEPPVLQNGYITFGAFNRLEKYNSEVYSLWAELLLLLPEAKLLIKSLKLESEERKKDIEDYFNKCGIDKNRLIIMGRTSHQEHLRLHNNLDIMLDPFPHNGGMTTLESVRMGVPVLTCEKLTRCPTSASILHVMGMDEWRAEYKADYLEKGVAFAKDIQKLKTLREQMRRRFDESVLGNGKLYAGEIEAIYRKLWQKWLKNRH
ncbi:MAG: tetratricopeptide repeat protein [Magnetococcales bacterium]|nr:tetratricopeptide repeat protein [Magnetococcales bacterium]